MRKTILPAVSLAFLSLSPAAQALDADPYCVVEPTVPCILEIVASGLDDLRPGYGKDAVLADYGRALAHSGRLAEALAVSTQIKNDRNRNNVLEVLAAAQVGADDAPEETVLDESMSAEDRAVRFAMMAETAFGREDVTEARALLDRALAAAREVEAETNAPHGHYRLASALEMAGEQTAAVERARAIRDPSNQATTLIELANRRANAGRMDEARALVAEAAELRAGLPADERYLALSRAAEFWIRNGETDRALNLARGAESPQVREGVLTSLIDVAARADAWHLAEDLATEAKAEVTLVNVYASCAGSLAARGEPGPNTCLTRAHTLLDTLIAEDRKAPEKERHRLDSAIVAVAVAESLAENPDAMRKLIAALPDARGRGHARFMIINAQTGRNDTLAILMALNLDEPEDRLEALARMARFLAFNAAQ